MDFSCSGYSQEESKNKYVAGVFPFGENMTVNPWRVLRDYIGIVRCGFFLSRRFRRGSMNEYLAGFSFGGKHDIESATGVFF